MSFNNAPKSPSSPLVPFHNEGTGTISRKKYNLILIGLITLGLFVISIGTLLVTGEISFISDEMQIVVMSVSFILSIVGIIIMAVGRSKNKPKMVFFGYLMLILSFGVSISFILKSFELGTIVVGIGITTLICVVFTILGFLFPNFFAKIHRVLIATLLVAVIASIAFIFMGISPAWMDYVVIVIFCGLIGYDVYQAANDEPTYSNAIMYAADIYLDIVNIFIRVLSILDRK